jgi:aspartate/methionine/tyrosine aminotransferase
MPRHPELDSVADRLGGSVFSALAPRIAALEGEVYPLHIGDTWMDPDPELDWRNLDPAAEPRPHLYCDPGGIAGLRARLVDKVRVRNGIPITGRDGLIVTAGATGALMSAASACVSDGDEVLLLAPYWPLIRGIVVAAGGTPVEVPVLTDPDLDAGSLRRALDTLCSERTVAVYISTPSNPTGRVLPLALLETVVEAARQHDLWILSDEVYEDYAYSGGHLSIGALAPERTATAFSFSKAYGMSGYRCGYLVGPPTLVEGARRVVTHLWYSTPTPSQQLALRALDVGSRWVERARAAYREAGERAAARLCLPPPEGSQFLFLDVARWLDERGLLGFLEDCLDDNLVLAPGTSFGPSYGSWVRLCFTCSPPDVVARGVEILAHHIGR